MGKDPAFPFYANDWLSSPTVLTMSLEQQGAYLRLLCFCWASGDCSLPDDDATLAKLSGMDEAWLKGGSQMLRKCFEPIADQPGKITNRKLLDLWFERQEWREKSRLGGVKSGEKRRLRKMKGGSTTVPTKREPKGNSSSSSSSSSSLKPKPPLSPLEKINFPDGFDTLSVREAVIEWISYKSYKTPAAQVGRLLKKFARDHPSDGPAQFIAAVDHSIAQGYKGCFPPKDSQNVKSRTGPGQQHDPAAAERDPEVGKWPTGRGGD